MAKGQFGTSKEAKLAGWFSRRHETNQAHTAAEAKFANKVNENKAPKQ